LKCNVPTQDKYIFCLHGNYPKPLAEIDFA